MGCVPARGPERKNRLRGSAPPARMSRPILRSMMVGVALGAAAGLLAYGVETGLIAHAEGMAGVHMDVQGPVAAVLRAVRPQLPALLARIAVVYVAAGAVFGLAAAGVGRVGVAGGGAPGGGAGGGGGGAG